MREISCAGDASGAEVCSLGNRVGAVEDECAVVLDRTIGRKRSSSASVSDLQRSRADPRRARVGVCGCQDNGAGAVLRQVAGASDARCAEMCTLRDRIGAVEDQHAVGSNIDGAID